MQIFYVLIQEPKGETLYKNLVDNIRENKQIQWTGGLGIGQE